MKFMKHFNKSLTVALTLLLILPALAAPMARAVAPVSNKGDANNDGQVNSTDALVIQSYLNGVIGSSSLSLINADTNNDGLVTHMDHLIILKYDVGLISSLPQIVTLSGDANSDGVTNSTDALIIQQFLSDNNANVFKNVANSDVNKDGLITNMDAVMILQYDVGILTALPAATTIVGDVNGDHIEMVTKLI